MQVIPQSSKANISVLPTTRGSSKMTDAALDKLYSAVANGITTLAEQAESNGDKDNHARVLFFALSCYLVEHQLWQSIGAYALWAQERDPNLDLFPPELLPKRRDARRNQSGRRRSA